VCRHTWCRAAVITPCTSLIDRGEATLKIEVARAENGEEIEERRVELAPGAAL